MLDFRQFLCASKCNSGILLARFVLENIRIIALLGVVNWVAGLRPGIWSMYLQSEQDNVDLIVVGD